MNKEIDEITNRIRKLNDLNDIDDFTISVARNAEVCEQAKMKHEEKLKELSLKWWERIKLSNTNFCS